MPTPKKKNQGGGNKKYLVCMDVFFMETHEVEARSEKEAYEKCRKLINHGMGEEITPYSIEES